MSDTWDSAPLADNVVRPGTWNAAPLAQSGPSLESRAAVASSDNGEEAARALKLGRKTGINPSLVQTDLPGYDAHVRAQKAKKAVENPYIARYLDGNPIAASVSGDDYDMLERSSAAVQAIGQDRLNGTSALTSLGRIADAFKKGSEEGIGPSPGPTGVSNEFIETMQGIGVFRQPGKDAVGFQNFNEAMIMPAASAINSVFRGVSGALFGAGEVTGQVGREFGMGQGESQRLRREVINFGIFAMSDTPIRPVAGPAPLRSVERSLTTEEFLGRVQAQTDREAIDAFLRSKEEHKPILLLTKAESAANGLDRAVEVAQDSKTKQRDPALFAESVAAHDSGELHIDAGKVADLYQKAGKVPAEGDGLLGFVPGLAEKIETAAATGGEVTVPVADYIAHVDPVVHAGLKDVVRLHDDGVTLAEAKEAQDIDAYHGTGVSFDEFNLEKIGTGEGNQAYGHGLYFAENKATAEDYQRTLGPKRGGGVYDMDPNSPTFGQFLEPSKGNLYKVKINAKPSEFLDWDAKVTDQAVLDKVMAAAEKIKPGWYEKLMGEGKELAKWSLISGEMEPMTGETIYGTLRRGLGSEKAASEALRDAGIPGIKYLDAGSRGTDGSGTRNYVVFDDKKVKITERNGSPVEQVVEATEQVKRENYLTPLFKDAESVGLTEPEFRKYADKIQRMDQHVLDRATTLHRNQIKQTLGAEWKRQEVAVRQEVNAEATQWGPFAAEKYLRENKIELGGDNLDVIADDLAPIFGYVDGNTLREALDRMEQVRAADNRSFRKQQEDWVKAETAARMEARHGRLAENIAQEAKEIALANHTFDVLADEVRILANAAGTKPAFGRDDMVSWARARFENSGITDAANADKLQRAVAKGGREAEKALLAGKFDEAFAAKQRQFLAAVIAKESMKLQKMIDATEKRIDRFTSEQVVESIDQTYVEAIREMLASVGVQQLHAPLESPVPLRELVNEAQGQLAVAPWLIDSPKKITDMSVDEFRAFSNSLKSMEHVGRDAKKLSNAQGEAELLNVIMDIVKELERFPFIDQPLNPTIKHRASGIARRAVGMHLLVERALDYTDQFNPHGPLTEWLDRPLRDGNVKEIQLTEKATAKLRALRDYTDSSINQKIPNNLLRDANDKTGFLTMNRLNLRMVMLNMGNWSNMEKLTKGFGVDEMSLRRWVDQNATAKDVAWVNGIWDVFKDLKPEADAVQLKDTGVPVDHIPEVPWEIKAGKLSGGYYPLSYDKYNSDIQARTAPPLFDSGYMHSATPHRYTLERTDYAAPIDLSGNFLQTKIQGMIHDIAFRLPVRNANKLITNQEFRTAVAQHWGKEVADLLPGWLRDIANSHNLDETYARDFVYAASLVRQNIINTLIGMNPGTFMKHGGTAAIMSADRVGFMSLMSAIREIGISGLFRNLKGLAKREDFLPDEAFMDEFRNTIDQGEKGENAREFVMQSSAVMRNRQRQWEDSVRGALDAITKAGYDKTFADLRQLSAQYGRIAVAWSDQATAMPTWLAAYKKAYLGGESNANAVFIADKEVSRAHGSNFVGDQPSVTRLGNTGPAEFMKWFTSLYRFWNHNQNNQFQLAWDVSAALGGRVEPGANAASISRRVGYMMAIIAIEELTAPVKDEDGRHGILGHILMASLRYFGGGWVGVREVTNSVAHGYEPSTGLVGTMLKTGYDSIKDLKKQSKGQYAKDFIKHSVNTIGFLTGVGYGQMGRTGQFLYNVSTGRERPRNQADWRQGLRTGSSKKRVIK